VAAVVLLGARAKLPLPQQPEQGSPFQTTECPKAGAMRRPVAHCWACEGTWQLSSPLLRQPSMCSSLFNVIGSRWPDLTDDW